MESSDEGATELTNIVVDLPPELQIEGQVFHLKGLDTEKPSLEINGVIYEGHYEEVLGTLMLFERGEVDPVLGYKGKAIIKLIFTEGKKIE